MSQQKFDHEISVTLYIGLTQVPQYNKNQPFHHDHYSQTIKVLCLNELDFES